MHIVTTYDFPQDEVIETEIDLPESAALALKAAGVVIRHASEPRPAKQREPRGRMTMNIYDQSPVAGAIYGDRQHGKSATLGGVGAQRLDAPPTPTEPSELGGQINILRDQLCFAQQLANEIGSLADSVGGPVPTDASAGADKGGIRVFKLGEIDELIRGLGGALGSIQSDLARLRRYVG